MRISRVLGLAAAAAVLLATAACGGDSLEDSGTDRTAAPRWRQRRQGQRVVGGQDFTEMQIMAAIYQQLLENDGYTVADQAGHDPRRLPAGASNGNVDIVPDYLAGITDYLNTEKNGPDADLVSSNDPDATLAALKPLAEEQGISILPPSDATDQNAFFVTQDFADENDLTTLSDLAALGDPIKLGAPPDCEGRADCEGGLTERLRLRHHRDRAAGLRQRPGQGRRRRTARSTSARPAPPTARSPTSAWCSSRTTRASSPRRTSRRRSTPTSWPTTPTSRTVFNELSAALTTEDLAAMNLQVDLERQKPEDVAAQFLEDKGLL